MARIVIANASQPGKNDSNQKVKMDSEEIMDVKIGDQTWSARNLDVVQYRNGDLIPEATSDVEWEMFNKEKKGCYCYYSYDSTKWSQFGKLYNGYALLDSRNICPVGWHLPKIDEWNKMNKYLKDNNYKDDYFRDIEMDIADSIKSKNGWPEQGEDIYGFCAKPSGYRNFMIADDMDYYHNSGYFYSIHECSMWWSISKSSFEWEEIGLHAAILHNRGFHTNLAQLEFGCSIRCIKGWGGYTPG